MFKTKARISEKGYLNPEFAAEFSGSNTIAGNLYGSASLHDALLDHFEYKLEHLLKWEDRNSMWFSLESRVPFLDHRLVEKTLSLSRNMIIKNGMTKYILREAMKDTLPENIRMRKDKIGFDTPADKWFRSAQFENFVKETITNGHFFNYGIIEKEKVLNRYNLHINEKFNINKEIWKWINLEIWYRNYFN